LTAGCLKTNKLLLTAAVAADPKKIDQGGLNSTKSTGYWIYTSSGQVYGEQIGGGSGRSFATGFSLTVNDVAEVHYTKGKIFFYLNGVKQGNAEAFKGLKKGLKLHPTFDFYNTNDTIQFCKSKVKKK